MEELREFVMQNGPEGAVVLVGVVIALVVSFVNQRRCSRCRQLWSFRPNGFTDGVGPETREEWECEGCGHREWKRRADWEPESGGP